MIEAGASHARVIAELDRLDRIIMKILWMHDGEVPKT